MILTDRTSQQDPFRTLLYSIIRREITEEDGTVSIMDKGVPTGSAIQPPLCNLYLLDLDRLSEKQPDGFYARYGDDFIFCHPDFNTVQHVATQTDTLLKDLALTVSPHKMKDFYFTGPGRPSKHDPGLSHRSYVELLGCRLNFDGAIQLRNKKTQELLRDLQSRIRRSLCFMIGMTDREKTTKLCRIVNRALTPSDALCQRVAPMLHRTVNDREHLRHIDYLIALMVSRAVSGSRSVKAFRSVSYRRLRREHGLHSLVIRRNEPRNLRERRR